MRKLIFSMSVSLDGYIAGRAGDIDFSAPDEELFRFHNEQTRELGAHLLGRRLYEVAGQLRTAFVFRFSDDGMVADANERMVAFAPHCGYAAATERWHATIQ